MKHSIVISCLLLSLIGCETNKAQNQSQAQYEADRASSRTTSAFKNFDACLNQAKQNSQVSRFFNELVYENEESSNKYELIASQAKINDEQVEVLKIAVPVAGKCREKMISDLNGTPMMQSYLKYYTALDKIFIKMIKQEWTIGEANEEKSKAVAQLKISANDAAIEFNNKLNALQNSENERRRQAAALMLPYMMQQQQNQQILYQQQLQNININRPVMTSPITTNCLTNGNQTNCTSR